MMSRPIHFPEHTITAGEAAAGIYRYTRVLHDVMLKTVSVNDQTSQIKVSASLQKPEQPEAGKIVPIFDKVSQRDADEHVTWHGEIKVEQQELVLLISFHNPIAADTVSADILVEDL